MKKQYKLSLDWPDMSVVIEVDHDKLDPCAADVNSFWTGADGRLADADENAVVAAIKMAGSVFMDIRLGDDNPYTINREFSHREGFPPDTFKFIADDGFPCFDSTDLTISEVKP